LTGHGFDTIGRAAAAGLIPPNAPHGLLIDTWYELGLIGAVALAVILVSLVMLSSTMTRASAAATQAVIACGATLGALGGNVPQTPWLTSLALAAVAVAALERGQYKTARPKSSDIAALTQKRRGFSIFPDWLSF
jgi:O-antigen ligase